MNEQEELFNKLCKDQDEINLLKRRLREYKRKQREAFIYGGIFGLFITVLIEFVF